MLPDNEEFSRRVAAVRARISEACARAGRDPQEVELLPVTKSHPVDAVALAAGVGLRAVGENRVQEAVDKKEHCTAPVAWELIGHLQSNKARLAVAAFDRIQSVNSSKLLGIIDRCAAEAGKVQSVLLQVNAGLDPAKSGIEPEGAQGLLDAALALQHVRVEGLMTIAPLSSDRAVAQRCFENLRQIRDRLRSASGIALGTLSMGMSGDLEEAIAEGSTMVRVGTALFGER
jgi:hypothetical protein